MAEEGELAIVKVAAVGFGWTCFVRKESLLSGLIRLYNFQAFCGESRYASASPRLSVDMDIN